MWRTRLVSTIKQLESGESSLRTPKKKAIKARVADKLKKKNLTI
jgi:hypothetical protein